MEIETCQLTQGIEDAAYLQVDTDDFGLDTADILALTDKELNQVVGLRRLAPYRSEHRSKKDDRFAQRQLREVRKRTTKVLPPQVSQACCLPVTCLKCWPACQGQQVPIAAVSLLKQYMVAGI